MARLPPPVASSSRPSCAYTYRTAPSAVRAACERPRSSVAEWTTRPRGTIRLRRAKNEEARCPGRPRRMSSEGELASRSSEARSPWSGLPPASRSGRSPAPAASKSGPECKTRRMSRRAFNDHLAMPTAWQWVESATSRARFLGTRFHMTRRRRAEKRPSRSTHVPTPEASRIDAVAASRPLRRLD